MELTARVATLLPIESGVSKSTGNPWQRATVVVEWQDGQYTKKLALSNMKKAEEFMNLLIGQEYTFKFDVTSREYNGKWYHDVNCYAWSPVAQAAPMPAPPMPASAPVPPAPQAYGYPTQQSYPTQPGYAAQPACPPQPVPPAPHPFQQAPVYNPAQPQYAAPAPPPAADDVPF